MTDLTIYDGEAYSIRPNGLMITGALSFSDWSRLGEQIVQARGALQWALGDWLCHGEISYGDDFLQAVRATGFSEQTLRNVKSVASRFSFSRRRERLSFQHHAEVAMLPVEDADALLTLAERHEWSREALREQVKDRRKLEAAPKPASGKPEKVVPRVMTRAEYERELAASIPTADAIGAEIPKNLAAVWAKKADLVEMIDTLEGYIDQVADLPESMTSGMDMASVREYLQELADELARGVPHVVCPTCDGEGCEDCNKSGWLNEAEWQDMKGATNG